MSGISITSAAPERDRVLGRAERTEGGAPLDVRAEVHVVEEREDVCIPLKRFVPVRHSNSDASASSAPPPASSRSIRSSFGPRSRTLATK